MSGLLPSCLQGDSEHYGELFGIDNLFAPSGSQSIVQQIISRYEDLEAGVVMADYAGPRPLSGHAGEGGTGGDGEEEVTMELQVTVLSSPLFVDLGAVYRLLLWWDGVGSDP